MNVCLPDGSGLLRAVVFHLPPLAVVVALAIWVEPSKTWTVTSVSSLALPSKEGVVFRDGVVGWTIVTSGALVLTSKLTTLLSPSVLPEIPVFSIALAVKLCLPAGSALVSGAVFHLPPLAVVVALAIWVEPSKTWTVTSVSSLASPLNVGVVLLEGV